MKTLPIRQAIFRGSGYAGACRKYSKLFIWPEQLRDIPDEVRRQSYPRRLMKLLLPDVELFRSGKRLSQSEHRILLLCRHNKHERMHFALGWTELRTFGGCRGRNLNLDVPPGVPTILVKGPDGQLANPMLLDDRRQFCPHRCPGFIQRRPHAAAARVDEDMEIRFGRDCFRNGRI